MRYDNIFTIAKAKRVECRGAHHGMRRIPLSSSLVYRSTIAALHRLFEDYEQVLVEAICRRASLT